MGNEPIDKIQDNLSKISQFVDGFEKTGHIVDIERDIVLSKLREVYEAIQFLKFEGVDIPDLSKNFTVEPEPVKVIPEPIKKEVPEIKPEPEEDFIFIQEETPDVTPKMEIKEPEISEPFVVVQEPSLPLADKPVAPKKVVASAKTEILADKFQATGFLNETLAQQFRNENDLSKKLQNQPLGNIFSAIAINDKFLFIKQLFNNDAVLFQDTVTKLNNFSSFNEAVRYLDENFSWDFNEPLVSNLLELVHRRYLSK